MLLFCNSSSDFLNLCQVNFIRTENEQKKVFVSPRTNVSCLRLILLLGNKDKIEERRHRKKQRDHTSSLMSFIGFFLQSTYNIFPLSHLITHEGYAFLLRICYIMATRIWWFLYHPPVYVYKGSECNIFYYIACSLNINRTDLTGFFFVLLKMFFYPEIFLFLKFMEFYCKKERKKQSLFACSFEELKL